MTANDKISFLYNYFQLLLVINNKIKLVGNYLPGKIMFRKHSLKLGWSKSEKIEIFQNDSLHNSSIFTTWMREVNVGINSEDVKSALIFVRDKYVSKYTKWFILYNFI